MPASLIRSTVGEPQRRPATGKGKLERPGNITKGRGTGGVGPPECGARTTHAWPQAAVHQLKLILYALLCKTGRSRPVPRRPRPPSHLQSRRQSAITFTHAAPRRFSGLSYLIKHNTNNSSHRKVHVPVNDHISSKRPPVQSQSVCHFASDPGPPHEGIPMPTWRLGLCKKKKKTPVGFLGLDPAG